MRLWSKILADLKKISNESAEGDAFVQIGLCPSGVTCGWAVMQQVQVGLALDFEYLMRCQGSQIRSDDATPNHGGYAN